MGEAVEEQVLLAERLTEPELSLEDMLRIKSLARQNSAERHALERIGREFADKHAAGLGPGANVRLGLIAWTRGKLERAREVLEEVRSQPESRFLLGHIAWEEVKLDEAADHLAAAVESLSDPTLARTAQIEILIQQRRADEADKLLADLEKRQPENPDVLYLRGRHLELDHQLEEALDSYEAALAADPHHAPSAFRKACILDLYGADQQAMALYRRCGRDSGTYVGALVNLGLFHDDRDEYEEAMSCFREVLRIEPNNRRAQLYYKGAEASIDMYYDEAQRKEQERIEQILRTPITDFEFSVRSRNCLAKMNIRTLGDLIHKTEAEMLAYKNFGETSLREIKEVLEAKNLSLGMALEGTEKKKTKERLRSLVSVGSDSEVLMRPVGDLELSVRSRKAMEQLDIQTIGDLVTRTESELMTVKNFGQTSLNEITQKLQELGLTLKPMNV